jgi:hypothetical protein
VRPKTLTISLNDKNTEHFRVEMDSKEAIKEQMPFTHLDAFDINN